MTFQTLLITEINKWKCVGEGIRQVKASRGKIKGSKAEEVKMRRKLESSSWEHITEQFHLDCRKFSGYPTISNLTASAGIIFWTAHLYSFPQAREFSSFLFPMVLLEVIVFHLHFLSWSILFQSFMAKGGWGVEGGIFFVVGFGFVLFYTE